MKKLTNTNQLGQIIRATRKAQGLTQEQLSAVCGVGVRFIRELEQGKTSCHLGKTLHIINMLGLSLDIEGYIEK
ncbi:MAG: helix-turn-helix transcriptional regulator [Gammaproteobacteria bacterium]|nr:helix-turn-helix transcriptional regulator [Gammaproteobacteria bacterium]